MEIMTTSGGQKPCAGGLAVFDLDGTLLDTLSDLHASVDRAMTAFGMPEKTREEVRLLLGRGMAHLIHGCVPEGTEAAREAEVLAYFKKDYNAHCFDNTAEYEGISQVVRELREAGIRTAVLSNKADEVVQELILRYFPGLFDDVSGERPGVPRKPAPDALHAVMERMGCPAERTVYIGDSEVDIETGRNAGVSVISAAWGFRPRAYLAECGGDRFAETPEDLVGMLVK